MTPSSTPEPELGAQAAKNGPDETIDPTADPTPAESSSPAKVDAAAGDDEPAGEAPAGEAPAGEAPAGDEPAGEPATEAQVAETVALAKDEARTPIQNPFEPSVSAPSSHRSGQDDNPDSQNDQDDQDDQDSETDEDYDYEEILAAEPSNRYPTLIPLIGSLLGLTAIAALMLVAFALPAIKSSPNQLPIGVSGTAEFQTQVRQALTQDGLTPFQITGYTQESQLRAAILDRRVYGGLSLGTSSITMLVSSGASPIAAQTLSSLANSLAEGGIPVTDLAKLPKSDPRGEGLAAANLPLAIAAILPALILIPIYRRRTAAQLGVTVGAAVLIGLGLSAVLSFALGSTEDSNFLLVSAGLTAGVLATSVLLLGLFAVAGRVGVGVGVALLVLFAAPLSGLSSAPEWLPSPWGSVGQLLPPGANATLLRSTAYFDGSGAGRSLLVLAAWTLIGLLLLGLGVLLQRRRTPPPVTDEPGVQELVLGEPVAV